MVDKISFRKSSAGAALAKTTAKLTIGDLREFYENRMQVFSRKIE